jgi:chorismate mutase
MIESHYKPSCALSDASQQLSPHELKALLESISIRETFSPDERFRQELEQLRAQIDVIDEDLVADLASRMEVSAKIGAMKKAHNVAIIQAGRWERVLAKISDLAVKYNLDPGFVKEIFCAIHEASVEEQQKS